MEPYYEKNLVINNRELVYKGIFRVDDLMSTINRALEAKGYTKREKKTEELVTEEGRRTNIELRPFKVVTNYVQLMIKIRINLDNVKETIEELDGFRRKFQLGDVNIVFDSWLLTDYHSRWGMRPFYYFMKGIVHKYIYNLKLESGFPGVLARDTAYIYAQIKKILNSYVAKEMKYVTEEDIRIQVEKDIKKEKSKNQ